MSTCSSAAMPIWAFHGAKDSLVPIGGDQELIDALKTLGNTVRFTVRRTWRKLGPQKAAFVIFPYCDIQSVFSLPEIFCSG
jgi:hypothetical protein